MEAILRVCAKYHSTDYISRNADVTREAFKRFSSMSNTLTWAQMMLMPEYEWRRGASPTCKMWCVEPPAYGGRLQHADVFIPYAAATLSFALLHPAPKAENLDTEELCKAVLIRDMLMCHFPDHELTAAAKDTVMYWRREYFHDTAPEVLTYESAIKE